MRPVEKDCSVVRARTRLQQAIDSMLKSTQMCGRGRQKAIALVSLDGLESRCGIADPP